DAVDSASETTAAALSIPRPSTIGLAPAARLRRPSLMMACASTVAVVVPSPATSLVLVATALTSWAPRFSKGSSSSISRAMDTPSLVTVGPAKGLAGTTCGPRGPRVTLTASVSCCTPDSIAVRALSLNSICLAMFSSIRWPTSEAVTADRPGAGMAAGRGGRRHPTGLLADHREHVAGRQDEVLLALVADLGAAVLAVDDDVALGDVDGDALVAVLVPPAGADGDDGALLRLLLGGVGDDQARGRGGLRFAGLDEDPVLERLDVHARHDVPSMFRSA